MNEKMEAYLKTLRLHLAETTAIRKAYEVKRFAAYLANTGKDWNAISKQNIEQYLLSFPVTRWARQASCCALREFFTFLKAQPNPAKDITFLPEKRRRLYRVPGRSQVDSVLERLTADESPKGLRNRLMVELAYGSGLRRAELVRLNIEDVNHDDKTLRVLGKGGNERIVPITDKAFEALRSYLLRRVNSRGPLFLSHGGRRMTIGATSYTFSSVVGIRPHLWRHACATHMLQEGCNLRIIQELLGHKRLTTTEVYTHITREDLRAKIEAAHPRKS